MRMKEICARTGLTERAVRLYVQEGLVSPEVRSGMHNASYHFSDRDVSRLQDIAALREAGFGLDDIREMLHHPEKLPALLEERRLALSEEIARKQKTRDALEHLSLPQQGELARAADALRTAQAAQHGPGRKLKKGLQLLFCLLLLAASVPLLFLTMNRQPLVRYLLQNHLPLLLAAVPMVLLPFFAALSAFMAVRYATCTRRAQKLPCRGVGRVLLVAPDTDVPDILFAAPAPAKDTDGQNSPGLLYKHTTTVQSNIFLGQIWRSAWNTLRPDQWFPLIQYTDGSGTPRAGTFVYGGLRRTWQTGDEIEIAWHPDAPAQLAPLHAPWLAQKAAAYLLAAIVLACGAAALWRLVLIGVL